MVRDLHALHLFSATFLRGRNNISILQLKKLKLRKVKHKTVKRFVQSYTGLNEHTRPLGSAVNL